MKKNGVQPLTLLSLIISSITMGLFAYRSFNAENTGYGLLFIALCILFILMAVYGFLRNPRNDESGEIE